MTKVLIISYYYPPSNAVGSQRPYRLAKYLPQFGWEPIILTPQNHGDTPGNVQIVTSKYNDIIKSYKSILGLNTKKNMHEHLGIDVTKKYTYSSWKSKFIKLSKEIITFPDEKKGWYKNAYKAATELLNKYNVDVMISTSPPVVSHLIARKLKRKYNIPWIADFRDPWSQKYSDSRSRLTKYLDRRLEINTIKKADALVSVSVPYVNKIKELHQNKQIFLITNGYDNDGDDDLQVKLTKKFTITYTGVLYNGRRDPTILLKALSQLINENKINERLLEVRFFGTKEDWLQEEIDKFDLSEVINLYGFLPKEDVLVKQRESQLLLLVRWDSKHEIGDCPAKIYEYLNARRPIIAIGGCGGIIKDMLDNTNAGKFADNTEELKTIILKQYKEYMQNGEVACNSNINIENYAYETITEKYANLLNHVSSNR